GLRPLRRRRGDDPATRRVERRECGRGDGPLPRPRGAAGGAGGEAAPLAPGPRPDGTARLGTVPCLPGLRPHSRCGRAAARCAAQHNAGPGDPRLRLRRQPRSRQAGDHGRDRRGRGGPRHPHQRQPAQRGPRADHGRHRRADAGEQLPARGRSPRRARDRPRHGAARRHGDPDGEGARDLPARRRRQGAVRREGDRGRVDGMSMASPYTAAFVRDALGRVPADGPASYPAICTDTRALVPGALFVALTGDRFDGHDFLAAARDAGAAAAVVRRGTDPVAGLPLLEVDDTLRAWGDLAHARRALVPGPVIAITGQNGKTSTKEMVAAVLATRWHTWRTRANNNNLVGVPLTILEAPHDT